MGFSNHQIMRIKDFENLLKVSPRTAQKYFKDIKNHFKIKVVTYYHYQHYFKLIA